ncbi:MAG: hypothetical protein LBU19_01970, partial [Treponema sp.]|nr:hypothetical protein [Treponema sp.]
DEFPPVLPLIDPRAFSGSYKAWLIAGPFFALRQSPGRLSRLKNGIWNFTAKSNKSKKYKR